MWPLNTGLTVFIQRKLFSEPFCKFYCLDKFIYSGSLNPIVLFPSFNISLAIGFFFKVREKDFHLDDNYDKNDKGIDFMCKC